MMLCELCTHIQTRKRGSKGHEHLVQQGPSSKQKIIGQANIYIKSYKCSACGALWSYTNDKNDEYCGWERE